MRATEIINEDWQKANKHDKTDGMSPKAVKAYRRENPGSKLKTAVTTKPSKLKAGSKDAKRRKSFCARMSGNKGPMKDEKGRPTPKAKALARWNCEEDIRQLEQQLDEIKKSQKDSNGFTKCWTGYHAAGTKKGKKGKPVRNCVKNEGMSPELIQGNNNMDKIAHQLAAKNPRFNSKFEALMVKLANDINRNPERKEKLMADYQWNLQLLLKEFGVDIAKM